MINQYGCPFYADFQFACKWAVSYELVILYHECATYPMNYDMLYVDKLKEFLMSKIKQTDITKLSQLEQQIEHLKEQKKNKKNNYLIKLIVIFK